MIPRQLLVTGLIVSAMSVWAGKAMADQRPETLSEWAARQQTVGGDANRLVRDSSGNTGDVRHIAAQPLIGDRKPNPTPLSDAPVVMVAVPTVRNASVESPSVVDISAYTAPKSGSVASTSAMWDAPTPVASEQVQSTTQTQTQDQSDATTADAQESDDQTHAYGSHGGGHGSVHVSVGVGFHGGGRSWCYAPRGGCRYSYGRVGVSIYAPTVIYSDPVCYTAPVCDATPVACDPTPTYCPAGTYVPAPVYYTAPVYAPAYSVAYAPCYPTYYYRPTYVVGGFYPRYAYRGGCYGGVGIGIGFGFRGGGFGIHGHF